MKREETIQRDLSNGRKVPDGQHRSDANLREINAAKYSAMRREETDNLNERYRKEAMEGSAPAFENEIMELERPEYFISRSTCQILAEDVKNEPNSPLPS